MPTRRSSCFVRRRRSTRGFTIAEVTLALIVFGMMTILFAAVLPMTARGAQYGGNYAQAAMLAQHKMDQLRSAGYSRLFDDGNGTALAKLSGLSVIDQPQPAGYPSAASGGTTYSFTTVDGLVSDGVTHGYFPPGSKGTVTIGNYAALHPADHIPPGSSLAYVTVTITWTGGGVSDGSYSTSAIFAST